jgi:hypothetical protein
VIEEKSQDPREGLAELKMVLHQSTMRALA